MIRKVVFQLFFSYGEVYFSVLAKHSTFFLGNMNDKHCPTIHNLKIICRLWLGCYCVDPQELLCEHKAFRKIHCICLANRSCQNRPTEIGTWAI